MNCSMNKVKRLFLDKTYSQIKDLETSLNQKIYSEEIEEIGITGHEEVIKNDKTSIVNIVIYYSFI